jgi:Ca2+-binding EF-hand superfamily protein
LTVDELKEQVKAMLPNSFAGLNFKKLLKAFDLNGNGLIEQEEFVGLLEMALCSNADTS